VHYRIPSSEISLSFLSKRLVPSIASSFSWRGKRHTNQMDFSPEFDSLIDDTIIGALAMKWRSDTRLRAHPRHLARLIVHLNFFFHHQPLFSCSAHGLSAVSNAKRGRLTKLRNQMEIKVDNLPVRSVGLKAKAIKMCHQSKESSSGLKSIRFVSPLPPAEAGGN
jgi:hypothetical protein